MTDTQKKLAAVGCLLTLILAILDQNIVSTASVAIVRDLDPATGLARLPWLISVYALAATAALPLYGKLCDIHGAKRVYLGAVALFLAGSTLCGLAQDMAQLIAFRAVQGLGGGGLMSVTLVVYAHLTPTEKRASAGGIGGLMAGLGMVVGPLIGGLFTDHLSWRWIFYVNLPIGLFVIFTGATALRLADGGLRHRIDYPGAALVAAAASVLLLLTEWGGTKYAWDSAAILTLAAAGAVLVAAFVWRQLTAAEPILPLGLFRNATLRIALPLQLLSGFGMIGSIVYTVVYLQVVRGVPATDSGLYLLPMAAGMTVSGLVSGTLIARGRPAKTLLLIGMGLATLAMALLATLAADTSRLILGLDLFLLGAGFGMVLGIVIMMAQNAVPVSQLGVATTSIRFAQTLGSAFGTAVFGVVLTRVVSAKLGGGSIGVGALRSLPEGVRRRAVDALVSGIDTVFLAAAGVMLVSLVLATLLKADREQPTEGVAELVTSG
ncbi:MFS transporter [Planotetraspora sp. A-T 1434]|uniref:MFS transporter n=1 Tax=Planotetraspora sp. A-T 1434 TaxID=2979219 RepID=UPI0021C1E691|nr:MFS transporter [Planotetraspora sp. A-T 1434]MCT9934422.1 MFS transporter [Planotetraspora sp. A-T 1434]